MHKMDKDIKITFIVQATPKTFFPRQTVFNSNLSLFSRWLWLPSTKLSRKLPKLFSFLMYIRSKEGLE